MLKWWSVRLPATTPEGECPGKYRGNAGPQPCQRGCDRDPGQEKGDRNRLARLPAGHRKCGYPDGRHRTEQCRGRHRRYRKDPEDEQLGYAKKIVISPTQPIRLIGGEQYLHRVLSGRSVMEGQSVRVDVIGNPITFVISKVIPKGSGIVTDDTEIELKEEP